MLRIISGRSSSRGRTTPFSLRSIFGQPGPAVTSASPSMPPVPDEPVRRPDLGITSLDVKASARQSKDTSWDVTAYTRDSSAPEMTETKAKGGDNSRRIAQTATDSDHGHKAHGLVEPDLTGFDREYKELRDHEDMNEARGQDGW